MLIIGLTGENCAGKGTVAKHLTKKGFVYLSLSDVIREELAKEGKPFTRENMIKKGNELREKEGPDVLAKRIIERINGENNYVIDSIRNGAEAKTLKEKLKNFFLIYITANPEIRFKRMLARNRIGDPQSFEEFLRLEKLEMENKENTKQSLKAAISLADKKIINEGSFTALYDAVDKMLGELSSKFKFDRPTWDEYFMQIARIVASRGNCIKRKTGAVIVRDKRIISTGYNGTPRGTRNCFEGGCPRCNSFNDSGKDLQDCFCSHAEENAIVQAAYHGISTKGSTMYCTLAPCLYCARMIINAGITEVVYGDEYALNENSKKMLKEAGVLLRKYKGER